MQTKVASWATEKVNKDLGTNLKIEKVDVSLLGSVNFKGVKIRDHHKDTLIFVDKLSTSILNAKKILDNEVSLEAISLTGVNFHMKTYKGETDDSMAIFLKTFEDESPKDSISSPFVFKTSNIYVDGLNYKLIDKNKEEPVQFSAINGGGSVQDFELNGPNVDAKIRGLYFTENRGVRVTNLTTDFSYSKTAMAFKNTTLQTEKSKVKGTVVMSYNREDFIRFTDKVKFKADFKKASVSIKDLKKFYGELSGNDVLNFSGKLNGTLNNFDVKNLNLYSQNGIIIRGDLSLVNSFKTERGVVFEGGIKNLRANYQQLKSILPNILGKTLPTEFQRLGTFSMNGNIYATPDQIDASLHVVSEVGNMISDLQISDVDNIDEAEYSGEIEFENFNAGKFFNDPLFGELSLSGDVKGSGFKVENINTSFIGEVSKINFKGYDYNDLRVNGQYQNKKFNGDLIANDDNLKLTFNGLADLSKKKNKFDFKADISHLDLQKTNLFTRDSISIIKGKINLDITGNTLDDMVGKANFLNMVYRNQNDTYEFKKFNVASVVKDSIKTITVNSKDIVQGSLEGKFTFEELLPVTQNALGSIYTNYNPYPTKPNQYLKFDFKIYNKIVEVFLPEVSLGKNTHVFGRINSNKNSLKLNIKAPDVVAYGNEITKFELRTDNQNKLYNSHVTAEKLKTKFYDIHDVNLINRTKNDTLFFKSVFKGGIKKQEKYNLDFFYTINPEKKSVVGLQKSNFIFKETAWNIDPNKEFENKVTFDASTNDFKFSPFQLISGKQKVEFSGSLQGTSNKSLKAKLEQVNLKSILPQIDSLDLDGKISGHINFAQSNGKYEPEGTIVVNDFVINDFEQGDLSLNVTGDNSYRKYNVNLALQHDASKSIAGNGILDFTTDKPNIDFNVFMEDFQLNAFSPLGQDILSNIRGKASGNFTLKGFLGNPNMNGSLTLKDAGLMFPYLNVDYDFKDNAVIGLNEQQFIFEDIQLQDTKHKTQGRMLGSITHKNFDAWFFDMEIDTENLLILDTDETDESLYYGTGFLKGTAEISGLADKLTIDVNGKTNPGTKFVIPLKDVETIDNYRLIHFKNERREGDAPIRESQLEAMKGLSLEIDLEVTEDALAQVVIDKNSGSQLSGRTNGNLKIQIDTRGKFNIFGDLTIQSGVYDFKYGGIINKKFEVQKGGTVSWNSSPFDADLNVTAVHKVKANPALLLDGFTSTRNIEIDLITKITGLLFNSKQELDIQMPNVNPAIASELEFKLNGNNVNEKTTQFVSLLAFGRFINTDNLDLGGGDVAGTATNALTSAFSNLLNTADGKIQLGVNYKQGQGDNVESIRTDDQVDVSVSTRISDRVLVNGSVGVPVGGNTQTSIVGEVKVEVLLNEQGNFRGTVFNRPNDIDYSLQDEGYTQGVGLSYQVNFNNAKELGEKLGLRKKEAIKKYSEKKDSVLSPHKSLINKKKRSRIKRKKKEKN